MNATNDDAFQVMPDQAAAHDATAFQKTADHKMRCRKFWYEPACRFKKHKIMYHAGLSLLQIWQERYALKQDGFKSCRISSISFDKFWIGKLKKLETLLNIKTKENNMIQEF